MQKPDYELRYPGQDRGINEVIEPRSAGNLDVTIHVSGGISYNHKGRLIFYNDPAEPSKKQRKAPPPRWRKGESNESFTGR